jgi:hypothetical protein
MLRWQPPTAPTCELSRISRYRPDYNRLNSGIALISRRSKMRWRDDMSTLSAGLVIFRYCPGRAASEVHRFRIEACDALSLATPEGKPGRGRLRAGDDGEAQ